MNKKISLADHGLTDTDVRDPSNMYRVLSLFIEHKSPKYDAYWTLKDNDRVVNGVTYPSLKQIFLDTEDPTGYTFAIKVFGSWKLWSRIKRSKELQMSTFNAWDEELDIRLISKGLRGVIKEAEKGKSALSASKYLVDRGWIQDQKRGRPSNKRIQQEANKVARIHEELDEDLIRAERLIN